ncbi:aminopeptidase P family protein [Magnetospira sp. QH-2]|uniref:aminopeptidase P family protein n=1 Tax=Magnetospira sp. (strain QH-2) TaxID=1288970 RepID=UPI0003E8184A|nr:aminopeptidase P family protein [Magnetospira sp. QH-2]CCQ74948.1 putative Xaa-Pro aminopeptidase [Magnetospira sp. QH-2]
MTRNFADRLARLRQYLLSQGLDGFVVPMADEFQGEYLPPSARRLEWLCGFSGSAGIAAVLADRAALFIDGRYTLQARNEVDSTLFEHRHLTQQPLTAWITEQLPSGGKLGYDPRLHTADGAGRLRKACHDAGADAVPVATNPIDTLWQDRPAPPREPARAFPLAQAGRDSADKRREMAAHLTKAGEDAMVLTTPESVGWLLNLRGADLPYTPVALAFAILHAKNHRVDLFIDADRLPTDLDPAVTAVAPDQLERALDRLGQAGAKVRLDPSSAGQWFFERLTAAGATISRAADPCILAKANKNPVELAGMRHAHRRDGVTLVRFLSWLDRHGLNEGVTESLAADRLEGLRRENEHFHGLSFPTIVGSGANGAIVHYRVTENSNRRLNSGDMFLIDSGAQYLDGTTDVTRTVVMGTPTTEQKRHFTLVLKGHINLAESCFPVGTTGGQIDVLARRPLWEAGLDYDHGTGHGVGHFLGVHEGPQRISKLCNKVALAPGMILSNEPGYYREGEYGIRIENLVAVTEVLPPPGAERPLLGFETLTLCPIDRRLVQTDMLGDGEQKWLNAYHERVRETLTPMLDRDDEDWLENATAPL